MPPVNSAAIETPVTEPMVMRTRLGGMVSVWAPVADSSATRSPGVRAARLHLGEQHRRDRRHVGGLRAGDARRRGTSRRAARSSSPPRTWPMRLGEKADHGARHAGDLDQEAEEHEQRHRQQDDVRHALVHPAHHDGQRRAGGERQEGEGAERRRRRRSGRRSARRPRRAARRTRRDGSCRSRRAPASEAKARRRPRRRPRAPAPDRQAAPSGRCAGPRAAASARCRPAAPWRARCSAPRGPASRSSPRRWRIRAPGAGSGRGRRAGRRAPARRQAPGGAATALLTSAVMRMCSTRRSATTAPSIASHRNRIEASSSDQMNGRWKT